MKKTICIILLCALLIGCIALGLFIYTNSQKVDEDLVAALINYLDEPNRYYDMGDNSVGAKINDIKYRTQPLHIEIDSSNYYYVCGYYNPSHENASSDKYESKHYCCATEYTWVKFESANEIQEHHNGKKMVVAFQINGASFVRDILSEEAKVPGFTHFQIYETQFVDGFNTNEAIVFEKTFIYLFNESSFLKEQKNRDQIYYSVDSFLNSWVTFPCVRLDDQYYITVWLYSERPEGGHYENNLQAEFGEYYEDVMQVMITGKYKACNKYGYVTYYGLLIIEDVAKLIKNEQGGN